MACPRATAKGVMFVITELPWTSFTGGRICSRVVVGMELLLTRVAVGVELLARVVGVMDMEHVVVLEWLFE